MDLNSKLETLIKPILEKHALELVQVNFLKQTHAKLLIMIERMDRKNLTMANCVKVSREISVLLDEQDPLPGSYELEVSSPGMDRPLIKQADYQRFCGEKVKIQLFQAFEGQKKFIGKLVRADNEYIALLIENDDKNTKIFKYCDIKRANIYPEFK